MFNFQSKERPWAVTSVDSSIDDLYLRSNRAVSVEPNLIAGGNDMKMNNGHYRHYLCQQKSLPNETTTSIETINRGFTSSETIDQSVTSSEENRLAKLKYFDAHQTSVSLVFFRNNFSYFYFSTLELHLVFICNHELKKMVHSRILHLLFVVIYFMSKKKIFN